MMRWLRVFFLFGVVLAIGCSSPSGSAGDENDPEATSDLVDEMDEASEAEAMEE